MLKKWFADKYKSSLKDVGSMVDQIGYVESKNVADSVQKSNVYDESGNKVKGKFKEGPGRGLFQFETKGGSGAFQTALNRLENVYTRHLKDEVPSWVKSAREHDDASKLTAEQQEDLLLADLSMKSIEDTKGLGDKLISEALTSGSAKELWLRGHWAGAESGSEDYKMKGGQWEKEMGTYESPFKDNTTEEMIGLMTKDTGKT